MRNISDKFDLIQVSACIGVQGKESIISIQPKNEYTMYKKWAT